MLRPYRTDNMIQEISRREFLNLAGFGAFAVLGSALVVAVARFMQPNLIVTSGGPVQIGVPEDYPLGSITFIEDARAYLCRDEAGFYALAAVCPHLGCTPRLEADAFACPCHGSRFTRAGKLTAGPATRDLARLMVSGSANGQLVVDASRAVSADYRFRV